MCLDQLVLLGQDRVDQQLVCAEARLRIHSVA